jgi:hypothetical protein
MHLASGGALVLAGFGLHAWYADATILILAQPLGGAGLIVLLLATFADRPKYARWSAGVCLALATGVLGVAAVEVDGRW